MNRTSVNDEIEQKIKINLKTIKTEVKYYCQKRIIN